MKVPGTIPGKPGDTILITKSRLRLLIERALGLHHIGRNFSYKVRWALEGAKFLVWDKEAIDHVLTPEAYAFLEANMMKEVEWTVLNRASFGRTDLSKWTPWGLAIVERLKAKGFVVVSDGKLSKPKVRPGTVKKAPEGVYGWIITMDDGDQESLYPHSDECPPEGTQPGARGTVEYVAEKGGPKNRIGYRRWGQVQS